MHDTLNFIQSYIIHKHIHSYTQGSATLSMAYAGARFTISVSQLFKPSQQNSQFYSLSLPPPPFSFSLPSSLTLSLSLSFSRPSVVKRTLSSVALSSRTSQRPATLPHPSFWERMAWRKTSAMEHSPTLRRKS